MATWSGTQRPLVGLSEPLSRTSPCTGFPKGSLKSHHYSIGGGQRVLSHSVSKKDLRVIAKVFCNKFPKPYIHLPLSKPQVKCLRRGPIPPFETVTTRKWLRGNFSGQLPIGYARFGKVHRLNGLKAKAVQQEVAKQATGLLHLAFSLGLLLALDKFLKRAFVEASIRFPSALFGMFCLFSLLMILDSIHPPSANQIVALFTPATSFIQRWLPLFYVPSLVVVPLAVKGIPPSAGLKIAVILVGGWAVSLAVAGYTAVMVRQVVRKELLPGKPVSKSSPFTGTEFVTWTVVAGLSFALATIVPTALGTPSLTALPFLLAATVVGYIFGSRLPDGVKRVLHPIITCSLAADLAAFILGLATGSGFEHTLGLYLTKNLNNPGAGDFLMGFLGTVILSFAFSMFRQRKLVQRHSVEIFSSIITSSIFSLYATAIVGRMLGLDSMLTRAIVPRCVTVALALPIASLLEAQNASLTAAVVVLTGLVGANFAQTWMDKLGLSDPIARGIATASSAHGLGTAALSAKEPEALPFCAIAYALTGIFCSVICSVPIVRQSLILVAG